MSSSGQIRRTPRNGSAPGTEKYVSRSNIHLNIFFLIASFGDSLQRNPEPGTFSSEYWYFVTMTPEAGREKVFCNEEAKNVIKMLGSLNDSTNMTDVFQKMELIPDKLTFDAYLKKEWEIFYITRNHIRSKAGRMSLPNWNSCFEKLCNNHDSSENKFQGLTWKTNSCALDASLTFLPYICYIITETGFVFKGGADGNLQQDRTGPKCPKVDLLYFSPAPYICAALDLVRLKPGTSSFSDWARELFVEVSSNTKNWLRRTETVAINWKSKNQSNPMNYLDSVVHELLKVLHMKFANKDQGPVIYIPGSICKKVFDNDNTSFNLGGILLSSYLKYFWDKNKEKTTLTFSGLVCFCLSFPQKSGFKQKLLDCVSNNSRMGWATSTTSNRKFQDTEFCVKSTMKLLVFIGNSLEVTNHFVAAGCLHPSKIFLFHDGMKNNAMVVKQDPSTVFRNLLDPMTMHIICSINEEKIVQKN